MTKFVLFSTLCVSLIAHFFVTLDNPRIEFLGDGDFFIYSREVVDSPLVMSKTNVGFGIIYKTKSEFAGQLRSLFGEIDGESITLDRGISTQEILAKLGHQVVYEQNDSQMRVTYGYSGRGKDFIVSEGQRINLQIVERGGKTIVGWPIILGSY